jgi:hypothetical protein
VAVRGTPWSTMPSSMATFSTSSRYMSLMARRFAGSTTPSVSQESAPES